MWWQLEFTKDFFSSDTCFLTLISFFSKTVAWWYCNSSLEFILLTSFNWFCIRLSSPSASSHFLRLSSWLTANLRNSKYKHYKVRITYCGYELFSYYLCQRCLQSNWNHGRDHHTEPTLTPACSPWLANLKETIKDIRRSVDHNVIPTTLKKAKVIISQF